MDEDLILREIVKSLAFEIEAVNQDNVIKWTTANGTPLSVKVRVRNKDEPRLVQKGAIPVPRIGITAPEKLRLISSDQTILSFNVYLEGESEKEIKRHNGVKSFKIGSCLGTYSDDEGPYLPGPSEQNTLDSDNCGKSESGILIKQMTPILSSTNTSVPHGQKKFFGKCKPGGCLDPPFGEDNYAYSPSKTDRQENIQLELNSLENKNETFEPGGCLDPPFTEDKYPNTVSKADHQETLALKSQFIQDRKLAPSKKSSEERLYKTLAKKTITDEVDSKQVTDIFARHSKENSMESKYSNACIITYPTDVSSNETLNNQIPNKKISIKSNDSEAQRQSYDNPVSYFVPPKDVTRYKDEERKYSMNLSSEKIYRSATVNNAPDELKNTKQEYIPQSVIRAKCIQEENMKLSRPDDVASKKSENMKRDFVAVPKENPKEIPSVVDTNNEVTESYQYLLCEERNPKDLRATESNPNKYENDKLKAQQQKNNLEENAKTEDYQAKRDMPMVERDDKKDSLPQSFTITQIKDTQREGQVTDLAKQSTITSDNTKLSFTQSSIKGNHFSYDSNDSISTRAPFAAATSLATAALSVSKTQSLPFDDKPKISLDSSEIKKDKISICNSKDILNKTNEQELKNKVKSISSQSISSSENNEFDVSSEHSIDLKHEHSNNVETNLQSKQELITEGLNLRSIDNVIINKHDLKDSYTKVNPESQQKRTSAVLQKKPFTARHDLDIETEDINKMTPLKRNTFTVIASDTSIQKIEEIEEIPENITDVYSKTADESKFLFSNLIENNADISAPPEKQPEKKGDSYTNVIDPTKTNTEKSKTDSNTKQIQSTFFDRNLSNIISENVTNLNPTDNQTKPSDSFRLENETNTARFSDQGLKPKSSDVYDDTGVDLIQKGLLNNTDDKFPPGIASTNLPPEKAKTLDTEDKNLKKRMFSESTKAALQQASLDDLHSKIMTDGKYFADPTRAYEMGAHEIPRDLYPKLISNGKSASYPENTNNIAVDTSQKSEPENTEYIDGDSLSDGNDLMKNYNDLDRNATLVVKPKHVQDLDSEITHENINEDIFVEPTTSNVKIATEDVEDLQAPVASDRTSVSLHQINYSNEYIDTRTNEHLKQKELTKNVVELSQFKNTPLKAQDMEENVYELVGKTESLPDNILRSGGYSGILSEVLSSISENKEAEEINGELKKTLEKTVKRHDDLEKSDTEPYGGYLNEYADITKESKSNRKISGVSVDSHNYPLDSLIKSSMSKSYEIHNQIQKISIPDTSESIKKITSSFDQLKRRFDAYETDRSPVNITMDVASLGKTSVIAEQHKEYELPQIPASIQDLAGLNKDRFRIKPVAANEPYTHYKQTKLSRPLVQEESYHFVNESRISEKDISPIYLDMSFYSYINDNKQRIVQTQNPLNEPINPEQPPNDGTVTKVKTLIRRGNEIRIPIDTENDITFNIFDKDVRVERRNSIFELPTCPPPSEKHVLDRATKRSDFLNKNLTLIYESELIPLHTVIKDLTQEVNMLSAKQEMLQIRMRNIKKTKSLRLIPVVKRCGCRRI